MYLKIYFATCGSKAKKKSKKAFIEKSLRAKKFGYDLTKHQFLVNIVFSTFCIFSMTLFIKLRSLMLRCG